MSVTVPAQLLSKTWWQVPKPSQTALLTAFFLLSHGADAAYAALDLEPSAAFVLLNYLAAAGLIVNWVRADRRRLSGESPFDEGFFMLVAWPLVLPYYLFATRGPRGALAVLGFAALYLTTYLLASALYLLVWYLST